jgi:hypothetical protein
MLVAQIAVKNSMKTWVRKLHGTKNRNATYGDACRPKAKVRKGAPQTIFSLSYLQDPIHWVESDGGPRAQFSASTHVVVVVQRVNVLVQKFVGVQSSVHPVDSNFNAGQVGSSEHKVRPPTPNLHARRKKIRTGGGDDL